MGNGPGSGGGVGSGSPESFSSFLSHPPDATSSIPLSPAVGPVNASLEYLGLPTFGLGEKLGVQIDRLAHVFGGARDQITYREKNPTQNAMNLLIAAGALTEGHDLIGHSLEVVKTTKDILQVKGDPIVALSPLLHDIGKIGIPKKILNKPGALTASEYDEMKGHAFMTKEILDALGYPKSIWEPAMQHQELWDGTGYSFGLRGEEIHLVARAIAVADGDSAVKRPGGIRHTGPLHLAAEDILKKSGVWYDPEMVQAYWDNSVQPNLQSLPGFVVTPSMNYGQARHAVMHR